MSRINTVKCDWCPNKAKIETAQADWSLGVMMSTSTRGVDFATAPIDLCPECRKALGGDISGMYAYRVKDSVNDLVFGLAQQSGIAIMPAKEPDEPPATE